MGKESEGIMAQNDGVAEIQAKRQKIREQIEQLRAEEQWLWFQLELAISAAGGVANNHDGQEKQS